MLTAQGALSVNISAPYTALKGGGKPKVHILGRLRNITVKGRSKLVVYKGEQITLTEARKLEKTLRK